MVDVAVVKYRRSLQIAPAQHKWSIQRPFGCSPGTEIKSFLVCAIVDGLGKGEGRDHAVARENHPVTREDRFHYNMSGFGQPRIHLKKTRRG